MINTVQCCDCKNGFKQIPDGSIDLIVTSPPYNCGKDYEVYSDERPWKEYYSFIGEFLDCAYASLKVGGTIAIVVPPTIKFQHDHKYADTWSDFDKTYKTHRGPVKVLGRGRIEPIAHRIRTMMELRDPHMRESIIWVKAAEGQPPISTNYCMGCDSDPFIRSVYETILIGSKGKWFHTGGTGRRGKDAVPYMDYTKDVWNIPAMSSRIHPAPFPEDIPDRLIKLFTHTPESVVLDPFAGIGTTLVAAVKNNRKFIGFEINNKYCEIARKKISALVEQKTIGDNFERKTKTVLL